MRPSLFYAGVFLVTAATLMMQVIQTRILSVVAWYHLAFFVISMAMFGLTAGAVWVYLRRDRFTERTLAYDLAYFAVGLALASAVSLVVQMSLTPIAMFTGTTLAVWLLLTLCLAVPFFFAGVVVSLALTRSPFPVGRVYGVDLVGAALGCLGALGLLNATDGPSAILWVSAGSALASICFAGSGIQEAPAPRPILAGLFMRRRLIFAVLLLAAAANSATDRGLHPIFVKGKIEILESYPIFQKWNSFSRTAVFRTREGPAQMWGPSPTFTRADWIVKQRSINIDGDAATTTYAIDGNPEDAGFLKYDVTNLAYYLPGRERAAVIGIGGGRDMLSARVFGVLDVTGVEINPILVRLLTDGGEHARFSGLSGLEGMRFEVDEARSWFARSHDRFDVIQMSLTDTWAATGAGAFTLSENGLYTAEAWRIFLDHLTLDGVFTVSRWYAPGEISETGRSVSLAVAALLDLGATEPKNHVFLASSGQLATLIVSRSVFPAAATATLERIAGELQYSVLLSPSAEPASEVLRRIVNSADREELDQYTGSLELDLTPATDERPFFFNLLPLRNPLRTLEIGLVAYRSRESGIGTGNLLATATLLVLFFISALLVFATIVVPLRPALKDVGGTLVVGGSAYFLLIGIGFMAIEIGLLQRLSVFLGHPIYSLSIVLFSIILFTGVGSLLSDRFPLAGPGTFASWSVVLGGYLIALPFWLPSVTSAFDGDVLIVRALLSVLMIAPAGVLMGWGFPTGMRLVSAVDNAPTPWFWGINGAAGVLASAMAVATSIAFGIGTTLTIGGVCYLLLTPAAMTIGFARR